MWKSWTYYVHDLHNLIFPGDHSEEDTPVPIPNTVVKGLSGDGTAGLACGRAARRRVYFLEAPISVGASFFCLAISSRQREALTNAPRLTS